MSDANRVLWSEGLFLRTQHFQQQDRFFEATVRGALQAGHAAYVRLSHADAGPGIARCRPGLGPVGTRHLPGRHAVRHPRHDGRAATAAGHRRMPAPDRCWSPCRSSRPAASASIQRTPTVRSPLSRPDRVGPRRRAGRFGSRGDRDRPPAGAAACAGQIGRRLHRTAGSRASRASAPMAASRSTTRSCRRRWSPARWPGTAIAAGSGHRPRPDRRGAWQDGAWAGPGAASKTC